MNDPHVQSLFYIAKPVGDISFKNPPQLLYENDLCELSLTEGVLEIRPKGHFPDFETASAVFDPFLRSWEIDMALRWSIGHIQFEYRNEIVIDRNPSDSGMNRVLHLDGSASSISSGTFAVHIECALYPEPPSFFKATPDVEAMWLRFDGYMKKREPLQSMAYFCLTVVETSVGSPGKRAKAAKHFGIDEKVLDTLGDLTAKGDPKSARKREEKRAPRALTAAENRWLEEAVRAIIRCVAEHEGGNIDTKLHMSDLPAL